MYLSTICIKVGLYQISLYARTHHLSTRRDQSVFNRCRIGHSRQTHEFLLKGEPPQECIPCELSFNHQAPIADRMC